MPGKIITFYSYKGGVGRSMALANIAVLLKEKNYKGADDRLGLGSTRIGKVF